MRKHSTHSISRVFSSLLMLLIAGVNLAMAQGLSSNDIKASWDFKNGTVAYSIVSADIPAGSTFAWTVDSKSVTDGISDSGQTITLPLTNKTRSGDVTITSADNTSQTIAFSIEPKAYGVDYDGNFVCSGGMRVLPVWTSDPQSLCQQSEMQQQPSGNPFDQSSQPQQQPQQQPAQQEQKDSDGVAGWIKDMFGSN